MSTSSYTYNITFTVTHARYLAAKVATDLKRIQRFYNSPSDKEIEEYELEITELLKGGYLDNVTYGFKRNGTWIKPTIRYTAQELASGNTDDDPGKIPVGADVSNAFFCSFLCHNSKWDQLSETDRVNFNKNLPFKRGYGDQPGFEGYFNNDLIYASGGKSINRSTLKNY